MRNLTVVYDGECPICRNYTRLIKLEEKLGPIELIDARQASTVKQELTERHYDLDQGMVVCFKDQTYFGADAINFLAKVNPLSDFPNRFFYLLFRSKKMSSVLYPALRAGRNFLLWLMNTPQINNLKKESRDAKR